MRLFFFFIVNYFCFVSLLFLSAYNQQEEAYKFAKYLLAFFLGMFLMEVIS